jgi:hypothetical protein
LAKIRHCFQKKKEKIHDTFLVGESSVDVRIRKIIDLLDLTVHSQMPSAKCLYPAVTLKQLQLERNEVFARGSA